ncbi:TRAP transporter small permease [Oceanobacillus sp. FSL K6-2867]|uniref:TRAP transporter small permease n=1 Tax=Oceanobacillus sp. FSL K6-2867 TaxID=2954748 RepID=UPI0030D78100
MKKRKKPLEAYFSGLLLFVMLVFLTMEVIARYFFNYSFVWTEELSRYLFIWFVYIAASYAAFERAHIKIDSIMSIYPEGFRKIVQKIGIVVWLGFNIFVTYLALDYALNLLDQGNRSQVTGFLLGIFYLGIPIGFALMSIRLIFNIFKKEEAENHDVII